MFRFNRREPGRRAPRRCAVVLGLALLAGCSASAGGRDAPAPPAGRAPELLASVDLRLPVQDYLLTDAQAQRVGRARIILIQDCMRRFGFDHAVPSLPSSAGYGPRSLTDRRYGITDAVLAVASGYGLGARDPGLQKRPPSPKLGVDGQTVLSGEGRSSVKGMAVPEGGCLGEAERGIDRSVPAGVDPDLGQKAQLESFQQSRRDDRVRAVFRAWSGCMARSGYDYADPLAAAADPRFSEHTGAEEIAVARADVDCKARANVVGVWFTVESAYQWRQIAGNAKAFEAAKAALAVEVGVADALVASKK